MDINNYCVSPNTTVYQVIEFIDKNRDGIALVVDENGLLIGSITDGDIRRFLLANHSVEEPCSELMNENPITAPMDASQDMLRSIMNEHRLRNIPLVSKDGHPKSIVNLQDLLSLEGEGQIAVIMAGGEGQRLRPLTEKVPKPMVHVGEQPILERIITNLAQSGVTNLYISVNYLAEVIEDYFKDGSGYGVKIVYLREKEKLGTAGPLTLLPEKPQEPFIVINGDIVTNINFSRLFDFHRDHQCAMCVAATQYDINIPYGVLDLANHYVLGVNEKPEKRFLCNAGIYVINPDLLRLIPEKQEYNMTDLLQDVIEEGLPVMAFPIHEYWVDVGQQEDLKKARDDHKQK